MKLPIPITAIPDPIASPEIWKQIERSLSAIAAKEKNNEDLYPSERTAYNAIAYARHQASKKQWSGLWQYLIERQVLQISKIAEPSKLNSPIRPTKPPQVSKSPKRKYKKKRKVRTITRFARLKASLIRLQLFLWFCNFVAYSAPLCHARSPIRNRPDGDRIKALLAYNTANGEYSSLKVYLRSAKTHYRMNPNVLKILQNWSNPLREVSEKKITSDKAKGEAARLISSEHLNCVLTDKWQDTVAIAIKLNAILEIPLPFDAVSKILGDRSKKGEIHQLRQSRQAYYALIKATEFESQWISRENAYAIAVSRGCTAAKNSFRRTDRFDYAAFGIELRKDVPESENCWLRWRDLNI